MSLSDRDHGPSQFDQSAEQARAWMAQTGELRGADMITFLPFYRFHTTTPTRQTALTDLDHALDPDSERRMPDHKREKLRTRRTYLGFMGYSPDNRHYTLQAGDFFFELVPLNDPDVFRLRAVWPQQSGRFLVTENIVLARTRHVINRAIMYGAEAVRERIVPPLRSRAR